MGDALPQDVAIRLELIANEYRNDASVTLRKLFSHYALSMAWLERQKISEDYQEFCTEIYANALDAE